MRVTTAAVRTIDDVAAASDALACCRLAPERYTSAFELAHELNGQWPESCSTFGRFRRSHSLLSALEVLPYEGQVAVRALMQELWQHHPPTFAHCLRVGALSMRVALSRPQTRSRWEACAVAGMTHDIGKLKVPVALLDHPRVPRLSGAQFSQILAHAAFTRKLLTPINLGRHGVEILEAASNHHERLDGTGFPKKRKGDAIGVTDRIVQVCDVFDACRDERPHSGAMNVDTALTEVFSHVPHQLCPEAAHALASLVRAAR